MKKILILGLCWSVAAVATEPVLPLQNARYAVEWGGMALGDAAVSLSALETPGCYRYESATHPVGLVRFFYGSPYERSEFCIEKGRVVPKYFEFSNPKRQKDGFTLDFDWKAKLVRSNRAEPRELPVNAQDRFGLQQAVRLWVVQNARKKDPGTVEFTMVEDDRMKVYRFAVGGREKIQVPAGEFDTLLVQRVDNPEKINKFWLAPALDHTLVKMEQIKDGKLQLRMTLLP